MAKHGLGRMSAGWFALFLGLLIAAAPMASANPLVSGQVRVMTRNIYLGADIFKVLEAAQNPDPALGGLDVPIAVAGLFQTVQYTNFPERAEALANEVLFTQPHLIGLQEVSTWYMQSPGDAAFGGTTPAETLVYNYLDILLNALAARGLHYKVAAVNANADVELPMLTGFDPGTGYPAFNDLRLLDRDVILVRSDLATSNPRSANYAYNVGETIGGVYLEFTRGWSAVDVRICRKNYRFVNTHLEVASAADSFFRVVQAAQMQELMGTLDYLQSLDPKTIILVGDFNSSPADVPGQGCHPVYGCQNYVPPYMQAVLGSGYQDAWNRIFWPRDGFTSGFGETIDNPDDVLTSRIDLVLLRPVGSEVNWVVGATLGDKPWNMTPGGLWPSDHAGVAAWMFFDD
ncbi:MAG: endonuclease/exonuclease/phosphatase family protein [Thermodesulfobacteriota bacterium]